MNDMLTKIVSSNEENVLVFENGIIIHNSLTTVFDDIIIENYFDAIKNKQEIYDLINQNNTNKNDAIEYNINNVNSGVLIYVPQNVQIKEQLKIFYNSTKNENNYNITLFLDDNTSLNYFEYISNEETMYVNHLTTIQLNNYASLDYSSISDCMESSAISVNRVAIAKTNSTLNGNIGEINDSITTNDMYVNLVGEYADVLVKTVAITNHNQEQKNTMRIEHLAKNTSSLIENYGVSNDNSVLVFDITAKIDKGMKQSNARQMNRGIVLGKRARLDANPLLLIDEFDVEASHGAAIGKIDEEQLYYLMSRGLSENVAKKLIINGFLAPLIETLPNEIVTDYFANKVQLKTSR